MDSGDDRRPRLIELFERVRACDRCGLSATRTNVVFGSGSATASLMLVGEAPGFHEDRQGLPFVGQAGKLLEKMLVAIGLSRDRVFIANVLKCRPPGNRDPKPEEIEVCRGWLEEQLQIIRPLAVCTMGNFSTKLLSGKPDGITRVRGVAQPLPGHDDTFLFPVFHPAAALYTPANVSVLEGDFVALGKLLEEKTGKPLSEEEDPDPQAQVEVRAEASLHVSEPQEEPEQLGLF